MGSIIDDGDMSSSEDTQTEYPNIFQSFPEEQNKNDIIDYSEFPSSLLRPIACHSGNLEWPNGSCTLFQGNTCVTISFFGPGEVRISKELPHRGALDIYFRPSVTGTSDMSTPLFDPEIVETGIEDTLTSIFESTIKLDDMKATEGYSIVVQEYVDDGSLFTTSVNAISIALIDSVCDMHHTVAGVTIITTKDKKLIIDPSAKQLKNGFEAKFTYVFSSGMEILYANVQGLTDVQTFKVVQSQARLAAVEIFEFYRYVVFKKYGFRELEEGEIPTVISPLDEENMCS